MTVELHLLQVKCIHYIMVNDGDEITPKSHGEQKLAKKLRMYCKVRAAEMKCELRESVLLLLKTRLSSVLVRKC